MIRLLEMFRAKESREYDPSVDNDEIRECIQKFKDRSSNGWAVTSQNISAYVWFTSTRMTYVNSLIEAELIDESSYTDWKNLINVNDKIYTKWLKM